MPVGVGDFDSYKLSKPEGLLHLIACVDRQSWEISVELIEMNTEFSMSLLDPSLPDEKLVVSKQTPSIKMSTIPHTNGVSFVKMETDEPIRRKRGRPRKDSLIVTKKQPAVIQVNGEHGLSSSTDNASLRLKVTAADSTNRT